MAPPRCSCAPLLACSSVLVVCGVPPRRVPSLACSHAPLYVGVVLRRAFPCSLSLLARTCSVAARLLLGCCPVAARLLLGCCSVAARLLLGCSSLLTVQPAQPFGCGFGESAVVWGALPPPSPPTAAALRLWYAWLWGREGWKDTNLLRPAQLQLTDLALTNLAESLTYLALTDLEKNTNSLHTRTGFFLAGLL